MKVYSSPVEFGQPDYSHYDSLVEQAREKQHTEDVAAWGRANGYAGANTGKIVRFGVADGYAQYMLFDGSRGSCLIHLPYGDAYSFQYASKLSKKDVLEKIRQEDVVSSMFAKKAA